MTEHHHRASSDAGSPVGRSVVTVLVVDDATVIRESLPALMPQIDVVGVHSRVETLLEECPPADLVVLDLHLANSAQPSARQGVAAVRSVVAAGYRLCVYSQEERRFVLAACMAAGATGIVSKSARRPWPRTPSGRSRQGRWSCPSRSSR